MIMFIRKIECGKCGALASSDNPRCPECGGVLLGRRYRDESEYHAARQAVRSAGFVGRGGSVG